MSSEENKHVTEDHEHDDDTSCRRTVCLPPVIHKVLCFNFFLLLSFALIFYLFWFF